jgi:hypothetical protein
LQADPARQGPVIEILPAVGGRARYRVFHAAGEIREYHEDQLVPLARPATTDDLAAAIAAGRWLPDAVFRARLTAARLAHPLVDNLYALHAARIQCIPFQFKPLLRFLRADRPRLLIADEVGVGKTIEAGLILKELAARQPLGNVLIVCPKALVGKWRAEMRRFDEEFRPLTAESLRYCLREAHLEGAWPAEYSRAIASLELRGLAHRCGPGSRVGGGHGLGPDCSRARSSLQPLAATAGDGRRACRLRADPLPARSRGRALTSPRDEPHASARHWALHYP